MQQHALTPTPMASGSAQVLVQPTLEAYPVITVIVLATLLAPVMAATIVLTWHGLRGTNPGPSANMLLKLVALVLPRGRVRTKVRESRDRRQRPR